MLSQEILDRPELALGPNPFISAAAPFIPFQELPKRLLRYPLKDLKWRTFPPAYRESFLKEHKNHFVPYSFILEPAADLQRLYRAGLSLRNPGLHSERVRTMQVATMTQRQQLRAMKAMDGGGGIWSGMTATGRTALFRRVMELIAPQQVIEFGSCNEYGWNKLVHVSYLHVDFATNGSRGGFLKRVLLALDEQIGTSLSDDFRRVTNIDVLLVEVCRQLSNVRCVLVAIDEKQGSNFDDSPWKIEFLLFYLSLMNLGINVLMLGNPLAFVHLRMFSQVMRRFSVAGQHEFLPAASQDEPWWKDEFIPRIRKFNLVEQWAVEPTWRDQFEFENTGGVQGLAAALHSEVQLCALRRSGSGEQAIVQEEDFKEAIGSARFIEQRKIALSVRGIEEQGQDTYMDLPVVAVQGGTFGGSEGGELSGPMGEPAFRAVQSLIAKFKGEQTKKANNLMAQLKSMERLTPDDLQMLGVTQKHLAEMHKAVEKAQSTKATKPAARKSHPRNAK